ncbi:MAG: methanol dehydrogenase, partial [Deltaproteobacteria bacterium]
MSSMLLIMLFFVSQQAVAGPDSKKFPELTGHVVDEVGLLGAETKAEIAQFLTIHEQQTSNQIVVAIIESLDGKNIEEYATALFRHWGLGQ